MSPALQRPELARLSALAGQHDEAAVADRRLHGGLVGGTAGAAARGTPLWAFLLIVTAVVVADLVAFLYLLNDAEAAGEARARDLSDRWAAS